MANDEKSKAEQYREERKSRIAETAKKNAKNMEKSSAAKKIAGRVIAIVLAAVIALGAVAYCLSYYGAWQRLMPVGSVGADQKVTVAEYEYYYMQAYNQLNYNAQYYSYYGYDYGYDTNLTPEEQTQKTKDVDGKEITWVEYLHKSAISMAQMYKAYYNEALKKGLKIDDADKATIDATIEDYKKSAENGGASSDSTPTENTVKYSLNAYLRKLYGGSVNKRFLRNQLEIQTLAQKYYTTRTKELAEAYKQEDIDAAYKKDKNTYDVVDYRYYKFAAPDLAKEDKETDEEFKARKDKSAADTKASAEAFLKAATDEKAFIAQATAAEKDTKDYDVDASTKASSQLKANIESAYTSEISDWLFADGTKVGDTKMYTDKTNITYTIVMMTKAKHQEDTVNVRHILFMTTDSSTGEALSDDKVAAAKKNAEDALATWKAGDKTEDSFAGLANDLSEDTGSSTKGGLYENVLPGSMVKEFNDWCFDKSRQTGDVEIVKTSYGYHVMYFVSKNGPYYDSAIRNAKATEDIEKEATALLDGDEYVAGFGPRRVSYAEKSGLKKIGNLVELSKQSSSNSSASN